MADSLDQLYQHIVHAFALKDELIDIDLNANASESGGDLSSAKQDALNREKTISSKLEPSFRSGRRADPLSGQLRSRLLSIGRNPTGLHLLRYRELGQASASRSRREHRLRRRPLQSELGSATLPT